MGDEGGAPLLLYHLPQSHLTDEHGCSGVEGAVVGDEGGVPLLPYDLPQSHLTSTSMAVLVLKELSWEMREVSHYYHTTYHKAISPRRAWLFWC